MSFWSDRAPREKVLIIIAAAMMAAFLLFQIIMSFGIERLAEAQRLNTKAQDNLTRIEASALQYQGATNSSTRQAFDRGVLVTIAQDFDLPISRIQPGTAEDLRVWFDGVDALTLLRFLQALETQYSVTLSKVQISQAPDNQISAQIVLNPLS